MSGILGLPLVLPLHVAAAGRAVQAAAGNEKEVGQPIQVASCEVAHRLTPAKGDERALRAPANGPGEMGGGRGPGAAREDELLQRRQGIVPSFQRSLQLRQLV